MVYVFLLLLIILFSFPDFKGRGWMEGGGGKGFFYLVSMYHVYTFFNTCTYFH